MELERQSPSQPPNLLKSETGCDECSEAGVLEAHEEPRDGTGRGGVLQVCQGSAPPGSEG